MMPALCDAHERGRLVENLQFSTSFIVQALHDLERGKVESAHRILAAGRSFGENRLAALAKENEARIAQATAPRSKK